jgi:4'-phosphopantetheinyl transferase
MRELSPAQIHLWHYAIGEPPVAQHLAYAMTLLSDAEKHRCAAFHLERHRTEYALSHAMLRLVLSEYAPVRPEEWQFLKGKWGKPEIRGPALDTPLWFNLSHTDGFAACVAGRVRQLGVDVENMNRMTSCDEMAKHFFAEAEYEYLRNLPPGLQRGAFFRIWTLKEAYIKAEGKGLSIPLDSFHFRFSAANPVEVTFELNGESHPAAWKFFEFQPSVDYRISIGAQEAGCTFHVERHDASALLNQTSGSDR